MKVAPDISARKLRERLASEIDPICRRNLMTVIEHIESERAGDLDRVMDTMVPEPVFHNFFGKIGSDKAPQSSGSGKERSAYVLYNGGKAVRAYYTEVCAQRRFLREHGVSTEFEPDTVVVDRHCIVTEGILRAPIRGNTLIKMGFSVESEDALYMAIGRVVVLWPFDQRTGRLMGEDVYMDPGLFDGIESRKLQLELD